VLLELAQYLSQDVRAFNVFGYITLRAVLAALTALVISFLAGPAMIRKLATYKIGQAVRDDGPQTHLTKAGTPTMGGALILVSIAVTTILWADWSNRFVWIVLAVTLGFGAIGWVDDYRKVVHRNPKGLSAREKYFWQSLIGLAAAVSLAFAVPASSAGQAWSLFTQWVASGFSMTLPPKADLIVPFFKNVAYPLGVFGFIVLTYFVIVGTSNAVNLTDGMDGLASGCMVLTAFAFTVFAVVVGSYDLATPLLFPHIRGAAELAVLCGAVVGACLGFLWYNAYPAQVFMGDTGSLPLGGLMGYVAIVTRLEIMLLIVGGVFVIEAASVVIQVMVFKASGRRRRVFRCSPLHHHYHLGGLNETQVVMRFWLLAALFAALALLTIKLR
jgi:phospho-N-acetylmuramoyl-pentapeptide-transferase